MAQVLEMREEWYEEALDQRLEMMAILSSVAEAYIKAGKTKADYADLVMK